MRIEKLSLKNFRGFEELEIEFPSKEQEGGLAVFIGENGSGKTSVLRGISYFLRFLIYNLYSTEEIKSEDYSGNTLLKRKELDADIKKGNSTFENQIRFNLINTQFSSKMLVKAFPDESIIELNPPINRIIEEKDYKSLDESLKKEYSSWDIQKLKATRENLRAYPRIMVFYHVDRGVNDNPSLKAKDITKLKPIDTFGNSFANKISFDDFFEWFRNTEDYENERRLLENNELRLNALQAIRKALNIFLPKFKEPRVQRQPNEHLIFKDNGHLLSVANLSHGERLTFAMVGDIIRRLSIANPELENPCLGEGIVMIDEIEQHLHPSWQRTIIPNLRKTFPNIQFIITTHSPQVLSSIPRENVFILEDFKLVEKTPYTYGKDTNSILYDLFGESSRPDHAKAEFRKLYRLIDDPKKEKEAAEMLKKLEDKYGKNDPDLIDAKLSFEFLID